MFFRSVILKDVVHPVSPCAQSSKSYYTNSVTVIFTILPLNKRHTRSVQIRTLIGQIVPCRVISLMLMALCSLLTRRTAEVICRRQCLGVSGSISITRSRCCGPLLNSTTRGTTVDQRSLLKALTLCCKPLAWQVSFLPGSSLIIARF